MSPAACATARAVLVLPFLCASLAVVAPPVFGQAGAGGPAGALPTIRIVRTDTPPVIDGKLDEPAWSQAAVIDGFVEVRPNEGATPMDETRIYLLYDDEALYIGGRLFDSDPDRISANILKQHTGLRNDDRLAVVLDPFNTRRSGYRFELNPNGVRVDALYKRTGGFDTNWDTIWQGTASIDEQGWMTEMAIPFKSLSFDPGNDTWAMNFGRAVRRRDEESAWVERNRGYDPSVVGLVTGFDDLDQGLGLDVVPSVSAVQRKLFASGADDSNVDPSLDVFYKVTPSLNAALTINTDFSATEVDSRQINLTRFSLFFPEKRAFFLQDSDLFDFGNIAGGNVAGRSNTAADRPSQENGRPFFSRRLGLASTGVPVDLDYGGKLSGRMGRFTIGSLAVRQAAFGAVDAGTAFVGRLTADVLGESSVGLIVTDGDPNSNLDNSLYGADFRYLNSRLPGGRRLEGQAWYQRSDTEGARGNDSAYGLGFSMPNGDGFRGGAAMKQLEPNFNPALGYVNRVGIREHTAELGYTRFTGKDYVQAVFSGVDYQRVDLLDGTLQSEKYAFTPLELQSSGRDTFTLRYIADTENVLTPFRIYSDATREVLVPAGRHEFERYGFNLETGGQRNVSFNFTYRDGTFYDGHRLHLEAGANWNPSKHFYLNVDYDWNDVDLPEGRFISRLVQLTTGVIFSARLSWVTLIQYDNVSENLGINSRLHWIPREGREGFIVLNHNLQDFDKDGTFASLSSDLTLKFDYTFRF